MKKFLVPVILLIAGLGLITYPLFISSGNIDLKIYPASVIMPSAYKVYGNPDVMGGRYNLFKAIVKNSGTSEIKNLKVQFRIPKLIDEWTDVPASTNLLPGQTAVVTCFPSFPQSITERNTSSKEKTEIRITYGSKGNPVERNESFPFDMTSVNDIVFSGMADEDKAYAGDFMENKNIYACMVSSEDPIIKHYAAAVQQKILCGEQGAGVGGNGQITNEEVQEKIRVMQGVYNATLISHMVYSETQSGLTKFSDNTSTTEHIRLPREVVSGNTGLCIELALLHASIYKAAGLHAVIFLVPGHAYPGIKVGNDYIAMESTGIGGAGLGGMMNAEQALQRGNEELKTFAEESRKGNPRYEILDIDQLYTDGFKDMELKPDPILAGEADKITQAWPECLLNATASAAPAPTVEAPAATPPALVNKTTPTAKTKTFSTAAWQQYALNSMGFIYPRNWLVINQPLAQLPGLLSVVFAPNKSAQIESYHINGAQNPAAAMAYISSVIRNIGENIQYSGGASQNNFTSFNGTTSTAAGTLRWAAFFRNGNVGNGIDGIIVGTNGGASKAVLNQIVNSIH